ncbi:hypothetical protein BDQ12DRAFT_647376 [Crucibulum laeve]|uniref:C3H1-type domain-containing protein n=1 Tax=Crucibulum laeve TaxID=68775 RepID=A0A5C3M7F5_9AGAR|nr:hypothetical protein BDQ12DRAFT_647376 [Crucibulum laeve]
MIFDPSSTTHLKPWLVRTLEPICDAEPGALADYILALLKHNVPESEMRKELAVQLDEFLEKAECSSFIDTLFTVLRTKSYLPYSASPSSPSFASKPLDNGIPIPLDGLLTPSSPPDSRTRKRSIENDERDGRPPAKGPRLNTDGQFSRYGNGRDSRSTGGWGGQGDGPRGDGYRDFGMNGGMNGYGGPMGGMQMGMGMGLMGGMNGMNGMGPMNGRRPQAYQPPDQKRGICRDYHNNGYCARGGMCKYSHGEDAVVPGQLYPMNGPAPGMPFMPMFPNGGVPFAMGGGAGGGSYDPHNAQMDIRPVAGGRQHQRAPLLPRIQQEDGNRVIHPVNASGELPVIQDLTPAVPRSPKGDADVQTQPIRAGSQQPIQQPDFNMNNAYGMMNGMMNGGGPVQPYIPVNTQMDVDMAAPSAESMRPPAHGRGGFRGGRGGPGGRGRGGTFGGEVHNFRPEKRSDKTLVVEKIPEDKLSLEAVNAWFKRFGTVTNVAIDTAGLKALVSFSDHEEAHAAWKSEDAVFGNRFVKVFWHRPMEGHGQVGARMLAASAPLMANMTGKETSGAKPTPAPAPAAASASTVPAVRKTSTTPSATASVLAAKQELLEKQIAEQKSLMASLSTASAVEKKEIMARLRKLGEEMTTTPVTTPTPASSASGAVKKATFDADEHERKEREKLDKELELHSVAAPPTEAEETAEDLKAKLERLKAEAASLGIAEAGAEAGYGGGYRGGYRGRARGGPRGYFRGAMRGGPPRASMKLDNRPKKLLLKGVSEDGVQAIRDWYESTGLLDTVEPVDGGDTVVSFKSRAAAEQGLAKGSNIPTVGNIQITWYTGKQSTSTTPALAATNVKSPSVGTSTTPKTQTEPERVSSPEPPVVHEEEEIVASGWGGGDDEDGMGML